MLSRWPIRRKLLIGLGLLLVLVVTLAATGFHGIYAYRGLVKSLSGRAAELPLATNLSQRVSDLRVTVADMRVYQEARDLGGFGGPQAESALPTLSMMREAFRVRLGAVEDELDRYREQLTTNAEHVSRIGDGEREWATVEEIESALDRIAAVDRDEDWTFNSVQLGRLRDELEDLQGLAAELPSFLHENMHLMAGEVRGKYRTLIGLASLGSVSALGTLLLFVRLFYVWVFRPLKVLVQGSRRVATGQFDHRIRLEAHDEMAELADALNAMTARFQAIRDDLDRQVQERTKQVVRSEQLASLGFLAAGVAHEINNPLASIAMCAESLEGRLGQASQGDDDEVAERYLRMIQSEAFRCKEITERLLDFSRMGESSRQNTDLRELVQGVIEMVRHLGKYHHKTIELAAGPAVVAPVNPQEFKQVVLNLLTNGLDSLEQGGTVRVELDQRQGQAVLAFHDDGCGMTEEVQRHLFEPFFTRRRGGQGTGLGLSITYRIVAEHGGQIDAHSEGPGRGSRFTIRLPLSIRDKEVRHRHQAA